VRFLIDECLSVDLVTVAGECGHEAQHVVHVGRAGWKDWNVVRYARDGDFVLITNNASDFRSSMRRSRRTGLLQNPVRRPM
jgi:predicted nuclease of predicted toxin-antitoxin system